MGHPHPGSDCIMCVGTPTRTLQYLASPRLALRLSGVSLFRRFLAWRCPLPRPGAGSGTRDAGRWVAALPFLPRRAPLRSFIPLLPWAPPTPSCPQTPVVMSLLPPALQSSAFDPLAACSTVRPHRCLACRMRGPGFSCPPTHARSLTYPEDLPGRPVAESRCPRSTGGPDLSEAGQQQCLFLARRWTKGPVRRIPAGSHLEICRGA